MPEGYSLNPNPSSRGCLGLEGLQPPPRLLHSLREKVEVFWALELDIWS
jgi:hypothetical protein